jgi:Icc-related predicted phosphoesterase
MAVTHARIRSSRRAPRPRQDPDTLAGVKLLAFSDLHTDLRQAEKLVELSAAAEVVVGVGDFASVHAGLAETIGTLRAIERPVVLVPGNNETDDALREACRGWDAAIVLHGEGAQVEGVAFFGLGAGVPITPWDWSFDLSEEEAARMLEACPDDCVLAVHSPPRGHVDLSHGEHLGSASVLSAIEAKRPRIALCGHIHEQWGRESTIGPTRVINLGPEGTTLEV